MKKTSIYTCADCRNRTCQNEGYVCRCHDRNSLLDLISMARAENMHAFADRLSTKLLDPCAH